jgi:hypothetical protein
MSEHDHTGVANPYALAETVAGRTFDWERMEHPEHVLEQVLETPYAELFDPKFDSPLYPGLGLQADGSLAPVKPRDIQITRMDAGETTEAGNLTSVAEVADFLTRLGDGIRLRDLVRPTPRDLTIDLDLGPTVERRLSSLRWPAHLVDLIVHRDNGAGTSKEWEPQNINWTDPGQFFNKAANYFDPVQGSVANCYLIAALASVAWARPYQIAHRTRSSGTVNEEFLCMIRLHQAGNAGGKNAATADVEVSERLPVSTSSSNVVYCRSSQPGEIWPGVYEKAFAKWITGNTTDKPDITATAWGSPVRAVRQLTNEHNVTSHATSSRTAEQLWQFVRGQSLSRKTVHPMVAWTYGSSDAAPDDITYSSATVAAAHAYSVLGWFFKNDRQYIVLRNPWGITSGSASDYTLSGQWLARHVDWWKPITMGASGVFAIEAATFKKYFAGIAVVRP